MRDLEQLWAIEQIKQLKSRYFQAVDEKNYSMIEQFFTEEALVDFSGELRHHVGHHGVTEAALVPPPEPVRGGAAAARVIQDAIDSLVTVHHGHDPQIEVTSPSTATGRWSLHDILEYENETMYGYGHYLEDYVHGPHGWQFANLTLTRIRVVWQARHTGSSEPG